MSRGPSARWFVARALEGRAAKLALVDAALATAIAIFFAATWRVGSGSHGGFEAIVPMLGTALRWSVGLPLAWGALGALRADREGGLLDLARRRGIGVRRWLLGRAVGAGALVTLTVGAPMIILSIVLAGFGGGAEGALARASLVVPSICVALASGVVFGIGGVVLGALFSTRAVAIAVVVAISALGTLLDLALPGLLASATHTVVSPFRALEDLQALLFDAAGAHVLARGVTALGAIGVLSALGLHVASSSVDAERARIAAEGA